MIAVARFAVWVRACTAFFCAVLAEILDRKGSGIDEKEKE